MTEVPTYRNQSINFQSKSMDWWFLYDREFRHERAKSLFCGIFTRRVKELSDFGDAFNDKAMPNPKRIKF